ncbi:hypothetical protein ABB27_07420 [Stenotrophomonas terrae]|uniref:Uncharacterized protein n=1 Tax=Stenotrophomonas terrae TaxID=405446 RepID=A0A0R0CFM5_9GAMM|nr:hypothetical protein ABB27_07420 [Stenotrophomonas terrae]
MWALLLCAIASSAGAKAAVEDQDGAAPEELLVQVQAQNQARMEQARKLAATGEALNLYAAAGLAPLSLDLQAGQLKPAPEAERWLLEAIAKGSDEPLIAATAVRRCLDGGDCAVEKAVATLQNEEGADAQLLLMRWAQTRGDQDGADKAKQHALDARRYGDQLPLIIRLLDAATSGMAWPVVQPQRALQWEQANNGLYAEHERVVTLFSIALAMWQPELKAALTLCPADGSDILPRQQCRNLLQRMADSDTMIIAKAGAQRLAGIEAQSESARNSAEYLRQLDWLFFRSAELLNNNDPAQKASTVEPQVYMRWFGEEGEIPAMRRLLQHRGEPLLPPAGWVVPPVPPSR